MDATSTPAPASGAAGPSPTPPPLSSAASGASPSLAKAAKVETPLPVTAAEYRASAVLLAMFVACMALSVAFASPFRAAGIKVFENPDEGSNVLVYGLLVGVFTALILALAKWGPKWSIQLIILFAVGSTIAYVGFFLLADEVGLTDNAAALVAVLVAFGSVAALFWHPEWYVVDTVGLLVAAASAAMFGISVTPRWTVALLVGLAIYDAIAVYRTKHMLSLADAVIELRLPVLLVIPKHAGYRFRSESTKVKQAKPQNKGEREAMFMGLGDLVMPSILIVSALAFAGPDWGTLPALGAAIGTMVGYAVLMGFVLKGNPQAGLPLLNGGAIVGFLTGLYWNTGSIRFW